MQWFLGLFAVVFLVLLGLAFTSSIQATMLVFIPFVALGIWGIVYHFRKGSGVAEQHSEPVFSDEDRRDKAA